VVGKFLLGMVSGGLVVTGALVVGSVLFPAGPANDNRAVAPVEEPITAPEATVADAGDPVAKPEAPAVEPEAPALEPAAEPEPDRAEETVAPATEPEVAEPAPETDTPETEAVEPATETAPEPAEADVAESTTEPAPVEPVAEPAPVEPAAEAASQPVVTDVAPAPEAPQTETVLAEDSAPAAGDVTTPETLAEPSKPAETTADQAAVTPEPAPAPAEAESEPEPAKGAVADASSAATAPEPAPEVAAPEPAPTDTATAEPSPQPVPEPASDAATEAAAPVTEPAVEAPAENAPLETELAEALPEPAPEPQPEPAPAAEAPAEPIPAPEPMPADPAPEVEVAEAAPGAVVPEMPGAKPEALPDLADAEVTPDAPLTEEGQGSTFKPAPGLTRAGEGVIIGRGTETDPAPADAATAPADTRPIAAFAAPFENPDAKPAFAIVLIDDGRADLDRAGLAALPIPASIALDPLDPATPERAAAYRAAGKEVVMLVTGIAEGAQASDVEVAFQSMSQGLPEAVAAMDLAAPAFQNNRAVASAVVPILKAQGRGLLTWDAGLNAADQVARREDLEAAVVFRDISEAQGDSAGVRRHLDRAVFKAGQDGRVAVVGTADPATLAALLEWTVEGKAATVALAPLTAVLQVD
jgi:polysaccharide deacetylase 2 family uncharacterized protein YibQ